MPQEHKATFESTRIPIDRSIELCFDHFKGFEEHYAANISMGGMFIRTQELHAPGTTFDFRFELQDGKPLIKGTAEVLWRRAENRGPSRPNGIGVRFLSLDLDSKYLIYRMVDRHIQHGGTPFDVDAPDKTAKPAPVAASRRLPAVLAGTLAALLLVAAGGISYVRFGQDPGETGVADQPLTSDSPAVDPPAVEQPTVAPSPDDPPGVADSLPVPRAESAPALDAQPSAKPPAEAMTEIANTGSATQGLEDAVADWARAWAEKDVPAYLSSYSSNFRPASGMSHLAWVDERRARLSRPGSIEVEISSLEIELVTTDHAWARFDQAYASATYRDRVRKVLEWKRQAGEWKISREEVETDAPTR